MMRIIILKYGIPFVEYFWGFIFVNIFGITSRKKTEQRIGIGSHIGNKWSDLANGSNAAPKTKTVDKINNGKNSFWIFLMFSKLRIRIGIIINAKKCICIFPNKITRNNIIPNEVLVYCRRMMWQILGLDEKKKSVVDFVQWKTLTYTSILGR